MNAFRIGDVIELVSVPTAVINDKERFPETFNLFERAMGKRFQVRGFNDAGLAELWLHEDASEDESGGDHSIWVEPENVRRIA